MAKCSRCGKSLGLLSSARMCDDCRVQVQAELQNLEAAETENERRAKAERAAAHARNMRQKIENGERIILYEDVYLPVDSHVLDEPINKDFSIGPLRLLGFDGWDVVAVVPRTFGIALTNTSYGSSSGETWGAGLGGNVVGVHVILKREVSAQNNVSDEFLQEYAMRNANDLLTE